MADKKVLDITKDVKWIGILDYDIVTFDVVMETKYGTTYNSYFIDADKKAIIDTTKEKFWDEYLDKIQQVTDPAEIEYIIVNHTEPDHSGNLRKLLELAPKATVVGSGNAIRYLRDQIEPEFNHKVVKDGFTLDLGNKTLQFISAPNLHWPDTIFTYIVEDKVLFTCDSFGCHYCHEEMFDDKVGDFNDAFDYYFDVILKPFSKFMIKAIDKIQELDIETICPGHGPILRTYWEKYVKISQQKATNYLAMPEKRRVFIPYVSAYQNTGMLAEKIAEGIKSAGNIDVDVCDIEHASLGDLEQKMTQCSAVIVGSPTINQNILLPVYKLFSVISPLRDKGKLAGGFGSYGWSGEGQKLISAGLENLKLSYLNEGVFVKFTPDQAETSEAFNYGKLFGETLIDRTGD
jgi:flavorubredoxin